VRHNDGVIGERYQETVEYEHNKRIAHVASLVLNVMDPPQTFDDIYNWLNFWSYSEVDQAF
jgi:hypothetical protein